MFRPLRCPNPDCEHHNNRPVGCFFWRNGSYEPQCRHYAIRRFKCKSCRTSFSRQTFRQDYRDHKPHVNVSVLIQLCSGTGLRQTARVLGLTRGSVTRKFYKLGKQMGLLNEHTRKPVDRKAVVLLMDEMESYEGRRNTRPVTIPIAIEFESDFVIDAVSAPIRPRGKMTEKRRRAIEREERLYGKRKDQSKPVIERVLWNTAEMFGRAESVEFRTDEKSSYPALIRKAFPNPDAVRHQQTNSKLVRDTFNPLFRINHAEAMARDLIGRLRRESWLVSKRHEYLNSQLELYRAHKNFVRPRFNRDSKTPAQFLGLARERISPHQLLAWRQDMGRASVHPFDPVGAQLVA